jgi:hypothetical protein
MKISTWDDYKWFVYGTLVTGGETIWDKDSDKSNFQFKDEDEEEDE